MMDDLPRIIRPPVSGDAARIISRSIEIMSRACRKRFPIAVKKIEGSIIFDVNDNAYIDFTGGFGALPLGGQHPEVIKAVKDRADSSIIPPDLYFEDAVALAEELARIAPISGNARILFRDSFSEVIDAAAEAARWFSGRRAILAFTREALTLSASSSIRRSSTRIIDVIYGIGRDCYECPMDLEPEKCRGDCLRISREIVESTVSDDLAAIIFEPLSAERPMPPPASYMKELEKLARDFGCLLIANEDLTAPARSGRWFALDRWNLKVDVVCVGRQLASGLPLGGLVAREDVLDMVLSDYDSCGGCALSFSAALATLKVIKDEGLVERSERMGRALLKRIREMVEELGWRAHGLGMIAGMWPPRGGERQAKILVDECFRVGLLLGKIGSTILIKPALNIEEEIMERGLEILGEKVEELSRRSRASSA